MEHELVNGTTLASSELVQEVSLGSTSQLREEVTNLAKSNNLHESWNDKSHYAVTSPDTVEGINPKNSGLDFSLFNFETQLRDVD